MTARERIAALAAAVVIAGLGRALLDAPAAAAPGITPLAWCYPQENPAHLWARSAWTPPEAVRVMLVARDAVTGERLQAALAARPIDTSFAQVSGGEEAAFWDLPPGHEMVFSASTSQHYSSSGYRRIPDLPGAALAMTAYLLPRASPLVGTVDPGTEVSIRRPAAATDHWTFVDRLRQSPLASTGLEEVWKQVFRTPVAVQPDGNWTHSSLPGLPVVVQASPPHRSGHGPFRTAVTAVRDLNRVVFTRDRRDQPRARDVVQPPYPAGWPAAEVALRAEAANGRALTVSVRARPAGAEPGTSGELLASGPGSLRFELAARTDWILEVAAEGFHPHTLPLRLEPRDRLWIPALVLERVK